MKNIKDFEVWIVAILIFLVGMIFGGIILRDVFGKKEAHPVGLHYRKHTLCEKTLEKLYTEISKGNLLVLDLYTEYCLKGE